MDYTNGRNSIGIESQPPLEFFRFYEDTEIAEQIFKRKMPLDYQQIWQKSII